MNQHIEIAQHNNILTVWLNRPEKKNALNGEMISELQHIAHNLKTDTNIDIVVLKGRGDMFCAGADFNWFKTAAEMPETERTNALLPLSMLLHTWSQLPQTTITIGHGSMFGGALGLLAVNDFVLLDNQSRLRLTEVLIGIYPAIIAPYLIKRMGMARAKILMMSAETITAQQALKYGLADKLSEKEHLADTEQQLIKTLQKSDASTRRALKQYLLALEQQPNNDALPKFTTKALSGILDSNLATEFIKGFVNPNQTNKP